MYPSSIGHFCKLYRANEHLKTLDDELLRFLKPDCYEIVNETDIQGEFPAPPGEPRRFVLRRKVIFKKRLPLLRWGTLVGDAIHNLRSALDHIVFTISYRRFPSEFADDNTTAFPICDSAAEFRGPKRRNWQPYHPIRGLPDEAKTIIEGLQPYRRGKDGLSTDPLRILREMDDIDKHRAIHITGWSAQAISLDVTHVPRGTRLHSLSIRPVGAIESGAVLAEMDITAPTGLPALYMSKDFMFTIAFGEGSPLAGQQVQIALFELGLYVQGILNSLHRFVPSRRARQ